MAKNRRTEMDKFGKFVVFFCFAWVAFWALMSWN